MNYEKAYKEQKPLSTEETELNSIAFLEQMGYTCIPPGEEQKLVEQNTRKQIVSKAATERQVVLISESNDRAEINWDTCSLGNTKALLERGLTFINKQLGIKSSESIPQSKQEWSEEDEDKADDICKLIEHATIIPRSGDDDTGIPPTRLNDKYKGELKAFVKSLRHYWKPSEEQMEALWNTLHPDDPYYVDLSSLYNDLRNYNG